MAELTLISKASGSLKPLIEGAISEVLRNTEGGIHCTEQRLQEFEGKYQLSTLNFLSVTKMMNYRKRENLMNGLEKPKCSNVYKQKQKDCKELSLPSESYFQQIQTILSTH